MAKPLDTNRGSIQGVQMNTSQSKNILGRSLELYFIDGRPDGMLTAEVFNWTGHVLMVPRIQIAKALARDEASRTGVYLLLGEFDDDPRAYIGEAEEIGQRLKSHVGSKEWWNTAVLITTAGDGLHKAHVKYLESRLIEIALQVGSVPLENGNAPTPPSLSEAHVANMEAFLETLLMVLPALRVDMFLDRRRTPKPSQPEKKASDTSPIFELINKKHGIRAQAVLEDGEFIVKEGSQARAEWMGSTKEKTHYFKLHRELIDNGVLTAQGINRVFASDYAFSSTSAAGAVVNGRSTAGPREWKVQGTGQLFKDWEAESIGATDA